MPRPALCHEIEDGNAPDRQQSAKRVRADKASRGGQGNGGAPVASAAPRPSPSPAIDSSCIACTTGRHVRHTCAKGGTGSRAKDSQSSGAKAEGPPARDVGKSQSKRPPKRTHELGAGSSSIEGGRAVSTTHPAKGGQERDSSSCVACMTGRHVRHTCAKRGTSRQAKDSPSYQAKAKAGKGSGPGRQAKDSHQSSKANAKAGKDADQPRAGGGSRAGAGAGGGGGGAGGGAGAGGGSRGGARTGAASAVSAQPDRARKRARPTPPPPPPQPDLPRPQQARLLRRSAATDSPPPAAAARELPGLDGKKTGISTEWTECARTPPACLPPPPLP
jgi:hypothetical protein